MPTKDKRMIILYTVPISLSGLRWAKKTGISILNNDRDFTKKNGF